MGRAVVATPMTLLMGIALIVCWGLQNGWNATFGPVFQWLGDLGIEFSTKLGDVGVHPFGFLKTLDKNVQRWLSQGVALAERGFVKFLTMAVEPFLLVVGVLLAVGLALWEGIQAIHKVTVDNAVAQVRARFQPVIRKLTAAVDLVTQRVIPGFRAQLDTLRARVRSIATAIPHGIATFPGRIGRLERTRVSWGALRKWLNAALLAALVGGVLVKAMGRLGLGCLFGRNGKTAVKSLCGMNPNVLDSLIFDAALLTVAFNLEDFAKEMQAVVEEGAGLIHRWAT